MKPILALLFTCIGISTAYAQPSQSLESLKKQLLGKPWVSLSVELRPQEDRTGTGKVQPFYVTREFQYLPNDRFSGVITAYADPKGSLPLVRFTFKGHTRFGGPHSTVSGAFDIDYILDEAFLVTPLHDGFAQQLNGFKVEGLQTWETNKTQDIIGKEFPLFNIKAGEIVADYDLIYLNGGMLFMGAKHVDGTPFDRPERRPLLLQIPLVRK